MFDIHEQLGKNAESYSDEDIIKAIIAGSQTGRDLTDQLSSGPSLKPESLDPVVKVLENKENHIVLWKMMPKKSVYNTVHEYNQLTSYGADVGVFMNEGESPEQTDSVYKRKAALVKYAGLQGELTQQAMLVRQADGKDPYTREVENKTLKLLTQLDGALSSANTTMVPQQFDGLIKQHYTGVLDIYGTTGLDLYMNDVTNIDVRGKALKDSNVEDAAQAVVNDRFGDATTIISNPVVFNDYVKRFHESKRVMVNQPAAATEGATMGQKVNNIMTQFGKIDVVNDIFWDRKTPKLYNAAATSSKAPATPVAADNSSLVIVSADTSTKFTDAAGSYFYGVTAKNQYGESAMKLCNTTIKAIAATESLDITFTAGSGTYAATSYTIWRTIKNTAVYSTAKFYPVIEVDAATWTASGYDGASAGVVRDRCRVIANTHVAFVLDPSVDMWEYIQLAATMKIDFAITTLARRFAVVNYGTPVLYMPGKISVIHNIGRDLTA
jgi:hypothetical protein